MSRNIGSNRKSGQRSFQLPTLPPWQTPKFKVANNATPLKRPVRSIRSPGIRISHGNTIHVPKRNIGRVSKKPSINIQEYDYSPFFNRKAIRESQIKSLLECERAAHCLVFHKDCHINIDEFRPDVDIYCGEFDDYSIENLDPPHQESTIDSALNERQRGVLQHTLPNYTGNSIVNKLRNGGSALGIQDPSRNTELIELSKYWSQDSLAYSLRTEDAHNLFQILRLEKDYIRLSREELNQNPKNAGHILDDDVTKHTQQIRHILRMDI